MKRIRQIRSGLTLIELLTVLTILIAVAGLVVPMVGNMQHDARSDVAQVNMRRLRDMVMAYWSDMDRRLPCADEAHASAPQLQYLFMAPTYLAPLAHLNSFDPTTRLGWRGPYGMSVGTYPYSASDAGGFTTAFGSSGAPVILDPWNKPFVIQLPSANLARIRSAGPNMVLNDTDDLTFEFQLP